MIAPNGLSVKIDQDVYVDMKLEHAMFFNADTKEYVARYNEAEIKSFAKRED